MKCIISTKSKKTSVIIQYDGCRLHLISCLSSIFQQTVLPEEVYIQTNKDDSDIQSTVRYYNDCTVMRTLIVEKYDSSDNKHFIHLPGNAIVERRYIEKELKNNKERMIIALSTKCSTVIMNKVRKCNTDYVDILAIIPKWVKVYSNLIGWIKRSFSFKRKNQFRIMYLVTLQNEE